MNTVLDDTRLESLRADVMSAVDADVRRRGRRARRVRGAGLACALVLVAGSGGAYVSALSSSNDASSIQASGIATDVAPEAGRDLAQDGGAAYDSAAEAPVEDTDREVIVTGSASVVVEDPEDVAGRLAAWVEAHGGRVDARSEDSADDSTYASLVIRVPADQVSAAIDQLGTYGEVTHVSTQGDDVTTTVRDLDARISALRLSVERLTDILERAESTNEVVKAEQSLTERQSQLEQLLTERKGLGEQVSLATLSVDLTAGEKAGEVRPDGFRGGLVSGWNALIDTVNRGVELVGVLVPWLGVALVVLGGVAVVRRVRRR